MTWFDSIYDLQYYNQPKGVPCYCEELMQPTDLYLQGQLYDNADDYTLGIYIFSADGLTQYEDATAYFQYYIGQVQSSGRRLFNARLKSYSPAMCAHECYIIRVVVTGITNGHAQTAFDKYTERYCQHDCCDVPRQITIDQLGFVTSIGPADPNDPANPGDVVPTGNPNGGPPVLPTTDCGEPIIKLISVFDCDDVFANEFYGTPEIMYGGTTADFEFRKVTSFKGRIVRRPREIERSVSYNCKLIKTESTEEFVLEGFEFFPAWKMFEIENQLHGKHIYVDDGRGLKEYQFSGGTIFKQVHECFELFKLSASVQKCTKRQIYNCQPDCEKKTNPDGSNMLYAIPANYTGGAFYSDNYQLIAYDIAGLKDYLRHLNGVSDLQEIDTSGLDCSPHIALAITSQDVIPSGFYYDTTAAQNKVNGVVVDSWGELCNALPQNTCKLPTAIGFSIEEMTCATPQQNGFTIEETAVMSIDINGYGNWVEYAGNTTVTLYKNEVTFSLDLTNSNYTEDPSAVGEPIEIAEQVATIGGAARPENIVILTELQDGLPEGLTITIDNHGRVMYYGATTTAGSSDVTIEILNLKYSI